MASLDGNDEPKDRRVLAFALDEVMQLEYQPTDFGIASFDLDEVPPFIVSGSQSLCARLSTTEGDAYHRHTEWPASAPQKTAIQATFEFEGFHVWLSD